MTGPDRPAERREGILLESLEDPALRLRQPMRLIAEYEAGSVIVMWDETKDFGCGDTLEDAIADFRRVIAGIYHRVEGAHDKSGPQVAAVWDVLQRYIGRP